MEKKSSKKFIIAIAALAMVVCLSVGGLIGVLAAQTQAVTSSFNVQYTIGSNIAGTIAAKYQIAGASEVNFKAGEATSVEFDTTDESHTGATAYALNADGTIALTPEATSVVFTYTFTNTGATNFNVTLADGALAGAKNVTVAYSVGGDEYVPATGVVVEAGDAVDVVITVAVEDANQADASYVSAVGAGLVWTLQYTA